MLDLILMLYVNIYFTSVDRKSVYCSSFTCLLISRIVAVILVSDLLYDKVPPVNIFEFLFLAEMGDRAIVYPNNLMIYYQVSQSFPGFWTN